MEISLSIVAQRISRMSRELKLFIGATIMMGMAYSIVDSTFNNFLNDKFNLSGFERSFLEFPRELPGFLVVFVSALLWFLCSRRLGTVAMFFTLVGVLLIGFATANYAIMTVWLFIYSLGQHLFMPLATTIGMELAVEGKTGQRLGQINAVRNFSAVCGSFIVFLSFKYLHLSFPHTFFIAATGFLSAFLLLGSMKPVKIQAPKMHLRLHREYKLFYLLAVLYGSRKQIFITFAPWVLVTVFKQPTQVLATLLFAGGIIGILVQPILGKTIDRFGERIVLTVEAVILIFVCFGYGFSKIFLVENVAFIIVIACFLIDQMLMSVGMARSTYIKKIAIMPEHVQPALTAAVTIDHIFSISAALLGGIIWNTFGFQYVFLLGMLIAVINFFAALQVNVQDPILSTGS